MRVCMRACAHTRDTRTWRVSLSGGRETLMHSHEVRAAQARRPVLAQQGMHGAPRARPRALQHAPTDAPERHGRHTPAGPLAARDAGRADEQRRTQAAAQPRQQLSRAGYLQRHLFVLARARTRSQVSAAATSGMCACAPVCQSVTRTDTRSRELARELAGAEVRGATAHASLSLSSPHVHAPASP